MKPLTGQSVTVPGAGESWQVEFFDPVTGKSSCKKEIKARNKSFRITLPEFHGSIAVRMKRLDPKRNAKRGENDLKSR
jgi:hypothetical protein